MVPQVAKLTQLDKIAVGDKIYSKIIFNERATQVKPPSQQEIILLDNGAEIRFMTDGSIWFKNGAAEPSCLFNGMVWLQSEVLLSGAVIELFLHADPVLGYPDDGSEPTAGTLYPKTQHPHVNYGWFDKAVDPNMCPHFVLQEEYENIGLPNEAFVCMTKRMAVLLQNMMTAYMELADKVEKMQKTINQLTTGKGE